MIQTSFPSIVGCFAGASLRPRRVWWSTGWSISRATWTSLTHCWWWLAQKSPIWGASQCVAEKKGHALRDLQLFFASANPRWLALLTWSSSRNWLMVEVGSTWSSCASWELSNWRGHFEPSASWLHFCQDLQERLLEHAWINLSHDSGNMIHVDFHQMRHYAIISRFARVGCCREFFPAFVAAWSSKIRSAQIHPKQRVMSPVHEMTVSRHSNL